MSKYKAEQYKVMMERIEKSVKDFISELDTEEEKYAADIVYTECIEEMQSFYNSYLRMNYDD